MQLILETETSDIGINDKMSALEQETLGEKLIANGNNTLLSSGDMPNRNKENIAEDNIIDNCKESISLNQDKQIIAALAEEILTEPKVRENIIDKNSLSNMVTVTSENTITNSVTSNETNNEESHSDIIQSPVSVHTEKEKYNNVKLVAKEKETLLVAEEKETPLLAEEKDRKILEQQMDKRGEEKTNNLKQGNLKVVNDSEQKVTLEEDEIGIENFEQTEKQNLTQKVSTTENESVLRGRISEHETNTFNHESFEIHQSLDENSSSTKTLIDTNDQTEMPANETNQDTKCISDSIDKAPSEMTKTPLVCGEQSETLTINEHQDHHPDVNVDDSVTDETTAVSQSPMECDEPDLVTSKDEDNPKNTMVFDISTEVATVKCGEITNVAPQVELAINSDNKTNTNVINKIDLGDSVTVEEKVSKNHDGTVDLNEDKNVLSDVINRQGEENLVTAMDSDKATDVATISVNIAEIPVKCDNIKNVASDVTSAVDSDNKTNTNVTEKMDVVNSVTVKDNVSENHDDAVNSSQENNVLSDIINRQDKDNLVIGMDSDKATEVAKIDVNIEQKPVQCEEIANVAPEVESAVDSDNKTNTNVIEKMDLFDSVTVEDKVSKNHDGTIDPSEEKNVLSDVIERLGEDNPVIAMDSEKATDVATIDVSIEQTLLKCDGFTNTALEVESAGDSDNKTNTNAIEKNVNVVDSVTIEDKVRKNLDTVDPSEKMNVLSDVVKRKSEDNAVIAKDADEATEVATIDVNIAQIPVKCDEITNVVPEVISTVDSTNKTDKNVIEKMDVSDSVTVEDKLTKDHDSIVDPSKEKNVLSKLIINRQCEDNAEITMDSVKAIEEATFDVDIAQRLKSDEITNISPSVESAVDPYNKTNTDITEKMDVVDSIAVEDEIIKNYDYDGTRSPREKKNVTPGIINKEVADEVTCTMTSDALETRVADSCGKTPDKIKVAINKKEEEHINVPESTPPKENTVEREKTAAICRLSNTLDILSDDEDEPSIVKQNQNNKTDSGDKQCINIEDDDDIMVIDEETPGKEDEKATAPTASDKNRKDELNTENSTIKSTDSEEDVQTKESVTVNEKEPVMSDSGIAITKPEINDKITENVADKLEKPKPLVPDNFFKSYKKNLADMTRDDLEEFCILKIVESIIDRSNLTEIRSKLKTMAQNIEEYKKKATLLTKQNRDLQLVLKSVQEEQKKAGNSPIAPLKITRSVGMQVLMTDKNARRKAIAPAGNTAGNNVNNRPARNVVNQTPRQQPPQNNAQQIPVPRLVPATSTNTTVVNKSPNTGPQVTPAKNVGKNTSPLPNGVRVTQQPAQKSAEKRSHNKMLTVDLTDDEPPSKVPAKGTPAPPVRLVPPQNLLAQRQALSPSVNSPRKVYIPISGPQGQNVRPGQTIMLKSVPPPGPRQRGPMTPMVRLPQNSVRMTRVQGSRHPAPLPESMKQYQPPNWKALPPAPDLKLSKVENGIVISWKIEGYQEDSYEEIASYQLYAYQETVSPPNTSLWKKIGDVKALPLPMACTLTQFMAGYKYYFAVRAVDVKSRLGPFSLPGSILLLNKM